MPQTFRTGLADPGLELNIDRIARLVLGFLFILKKSIIFK